MYAKVNGYKIFFDVEGLQFVPDGPVMREKPVCFVLHGGPGSDHSHFLPGLSGLAEKMQLIYIDDRNCGRSERIDPLTNTMKQNVEDIEALREYLGLDKVFILGQSYGGMKAQYYVINHPEHLYGAIISCTSPNAAGIAADRVAKHVKEWGTEEQYDTWTSGKLGKGEITFNEFMDIMGPLYHGPGKFDAREAIDSNKRVIKNDEVTRNQMWHGDLVDFDFTEQLKSVKVPVLVMSGEFDFITDEKATRSIHEAIPGSEYHMFKGAAHSIFADYPDEVNALIADFAYRHFK